ncbi:MAG: hypothetical protein GDA53_09930 [Rhodobacteraceae bacterium]|nr:hypothetical protein [Paracoccaceae bacterium]
MTDSIDYGAMMHRTMRGLIRELLSDIEAAGVLPGDHHFFITFDTRHRGVDIAHWLRGRYPDQMTVVIQHWFDNLSVSEDSFAVTLNFGNRPERLTIPFGAILAFVDPSVEFGLRFEVSDNSAGEEAARSVPESPMITLTGEDAPNSSGRDAEVVSLDSFRKG